jgi:hypothetical protein
MARLNAADLKVDTFVPLPDDGGAEPESTLWDSTGCCDSRMDCSTACRQPTNVCEVCG